MIPFFTLESSVFVFKLQYIVAFSSILWAKFTLESSIQKCIRLSFWSQVNFHVFIMVEFFNSTFLQKKKKQGKLQSVFQSPENSKRRNPWDSHCFVVFLHRKELGRNIWKPDTYGVSNSKIKLKTSLTAEHNTVFKLYMQSGLEAFFLVQFLKSASSY